MDFKKTKELKEIVRIYNNETDRDRFIKDIIDWAISVECDEPIVKEMLADEVPTKWILRHIVNDVVTAGRYILNLDDIIKKVL